MASAIALARAVAVTLAASIAVTLVGMRAAGAQEVQSPDHSPAEANERARDILSRAEFQEPEPSLIDRIGGWFQDRIADLLGSLTGADNPVVAWVAVAVIAVLVGLLILHLARTAQRIPSEDQAVLPDERRPAREWEAEAVAHEARGEWKDALRCRYRALVQDLVERGLAPDVPGRTAGEYRVDVAASLPEAAAAFAGATDLFELAWYGDEPTGADENARFRRLASDVLTGVPR